MNLDILDVNIVEKIILNMQEKLIQNKEDESRLYENIEITENLYIFITLGKEKLKSIDSPGVKDAFIILISYMCKIFLQIKDYQIKFVLSIWI